MNRCRVSEDLRAYQMRQAEPVTKDDSELNDALIDALKGHDAFKVLSDHGFFLGMTDDELIRWAFRFNFNMHKLAEGKL